MARKLSSGPVADRDWEVEDALRTLTRAQEIQANAELMAKVKKLAAKRSTEMDAIADGAECWRVASDAPRRRRYRWTRHPGLDAQKRVDFI